MKKFLPQFYSSKMESMINEAGLKTQPETFFLRTLVISLSISLAISFFAGEYMLYIFAAGAAAIFALMHGLIYIAIERRVNFIENILPDTLELMSANMRAGFIPSRALVLSARKEFGPLAKAIKTAGKNLMTGGTLEDAFNYLGGFVNSDILKSTMKLINEGSRSGGQLVSLLEETAIDIRRKQAIKKEVKANILMYGIFIVVASAIAAPVLYALTIHLVEMMSGFGSSINIDSQYISGAGISVMGAGGATQQISQDFLFIFSIISIIITTFFSSLIIGIIDSGKEKTGIKYIPVFMALALVIFFIANGFMAAFFST